MDLPDDVVSLFESKVAHVGSREGVLVELVTDERVSSRLNPKFPSLLFVGKEFSMLYVVDDWSYPYVTGVDVEQVD